MAYARFARDSDVYVFMSSSGWLECCGCILGEDSYAATSTQAMVEHLAEHRDAGHSVPAIEAALREDDHENWVDYQRCELEGCEERATCGSSTPTGYIVSCGVKHGKSLGGFSKWPSL